MSTNLKDFELQLQRLINMETDIDQLKKCKTDTTQCSGFNNDNYNGETYDEIYKMMQEVVYNDSNNFSVFEKDFTDLSGGVQGILTNKHVLPAQYKEVKELRNDLDNKMRDILNQGETDVTRMHDSDVYMTFGWTLLATSVLYYLFSKL
jgi:hypothetical protein